MSLRLMWHLLYCVGAAGVERSAMALSAIPYVWVDYQTNCPGCRVFLAPHYSSVLSLPAIVKMFRPASSERMSTFMA